MKCAAWVTGSKTTILPGGSCTDMTAFCPGGSSRYSSVNDSMPVVEVVRQVDAGAPEHLAGIFDRRERIRIVGGDAADARADREDDLDHLVQRRLVAGGTERTIVETFVDGLEAGIGAEHAAAAGAEHVPRHLEQAEPGGVQEGGDGRVGV